MSEQKILEEGNETEKVKIGSFEFGDVVVDAELCIADNQPTLRKVNRLMRYRFNPGDNTLWVFLEKPDFVVPIDSEYWKFLVEEAIKQHMEEGNPPTQPIIVRIPDKGSPAIIQKGLQPAIELSFKPKTKKKGLFDRLQGR